MKKYRITFHNGPMSSSHRDVDIEADSADEALKLAYRQPDARRYTKVTVQEIPVGRKVIGVEFSYTDTFFNETSTECLFIEADSELDARDYYNRNIKGRRFWFDPGKPDDSGKNVYGAIISTYFAVCKANFKA